MKKPFKPFNVALNQPTLRNLKNITAQINKLNILTQRAASVLSIDGQWQIASYEQGVLCIAVENITIASKLRYMQHQYIKMLKEVPVFVGVNRLKIIIDNKPKSKTVEHLPLPSLSGDTQTLLIEAAKLFHDPEITQILVRMARKK